MSFIFYLSLFILSWAQESVENKESFYYYEPPILQKRNLLQQGCQQENLRNLFIETINKEKEKLMEQLKNSRLDDKKKREHRSQFDKFVAEQKKGFDKEYLLYRQKCRDLVEKIKKEDPLKKEFKDFPRSRGIKLSPASI